MSFIIESKVNGHDLCTMRWEIKLYCFSFESDKKGEQIYKDFGFFLILFWVIIVMKHVSDRCNAYAIYISCELLTGKKRRNIRSGRLNDSENAENGNVTNVTRTRGTLGRRRGEGEELNRSWVGGAGWAGESETSVSDLSAYGRYFSGLECEMLYPFRIPTSPTFFGSTLIFNSDGNVTWRNGDVLQRELIVTRR